MDNAEALRALERIQRSYMQLYKFVGALLDAHNDDDVVPEEIMQAGFSGYNIDSVGVHYFDVIRARLTDPGYVRVPVDGRNGKPLITDTMKADNHGEHQFGHGAICYECHDVTPDDDCKVCGGEIEYVEQITVPWDTCKKIYQAMVISATKETSHD